MRADAPLGLKRRKPLIKRRAVVVLKEIAIVEHAEGATYWLKQRFEPFEPRAEMDTHGWCSFSEGGGGEMPVMGHRSP